MDIKLISLDIFQTLVDVDTIKHDICKVLLKGDYSPEYADELWDVTTVKIVDYFNNEIIEDPTFRSVKYIYEKCYSDVFHEFDIPIWKVKFKDANQNLKSGRSPDRPLRLYRAGSGHALQRPEQRTGHRGQHYDHEGLCPHSAAGVPEPIPGQAPGHHREKVDRSRR